MSDKSKVCEYCGAVCRETDTYCKSCSRTFQQTTPADEAAIDGISDGELRAFIGKNADYYLRKFKKAKTQRLPFQLNFSALFFGFLWFFYRRIYKIGLLYLGGILLLTIALNTLIPVAFQSQIDAFYEVREEYYEYHAYLRDEMKLEPHQTTPKSEALYELMQYRHGQLRLIKFLTTAPMPVINLLVCLSANRLYKRHITQSYTTAQSGTSLPAAVAAGGAAFLILLVAALLMYQIPAVARLQEAMQYIL